MFSANTKDDGANLKNAAQIAANDASCDLRDAANQAGRKVRSLYNSASDEMSHASDTVTAEIRTNPIRSTAIALGLGLLLGALIRR